MTTYEDAAASLIERIRNLDHESVKRLLADALRENFNVGLQAGSRLALSIEKAAREVVAAEDGLASTVHADSATSIEAERRYDAAWAALRGALSPG